MKFAHALTITTILLSTSAYARIGDTFDAITQRYGQGEKQESNRLPGAEKYYFVKNGFGIEVMILNGTCVMEILHRQEGEISDEEIEELLKLNGKEHEWTINRETNQWLRNDGKISAFRQPGHPDFFFMQDVAATKRASQEDAKAKLNGF